MINCYMVRQYSIITYQYNFIYIIIIQKKINLIMKAKLMQILLCFIFIKHISSQCSINCNTCTSPLVCITPCPYYFNYSSSSSPNCFLNTTRYATSLIVSYSNILSYINITNQITCSPFTKNLFGSYSYSSVITVFNVSNLPPHGVIRVRTAIAWIDNWASWSLFTIFIDNYNITSTNYSNTNITALSGGTCNTTSYGISYGVVDTNHYNHNSSSTNVSFNMGPCNCFINYTILGCPDVNNPICWVCQPCSWAIADIYIVFGNCFTGCLTCNGNNCFSCGNITTTIYYLSGYACATTCSSGYFIPSVNPTPNVCNICDVSCIKCSLNSTYCGAAVNCSTGYIFISNNKTCINKCPDGTYNNSGACVNCNSACLTCNGGSSSNCTSCPTNSYLYMSSCLASCPVNWIPNLQICQDCTTSCVGLTISIYTIANSFSSPVYILMNFSNNVDFQNFSMSDFQTISFSNQSHNINMFNVQFINITSNSYTIRITPQTPIIIINQTVTVTTMLPPTTRMNGSNNVIMLNSVFNSSQNLNWTYIYNPSTQNQQNTLTDLAEVSSNFNIVTTFIGVQQIKKFGFILLMLNSLQITSCILLLNIYLPKNLYQFVRFFASLIFFDVPPYQQPLTSTKYILKYPVANYNRRFMTTVLNQTNFQRTGFSSVFLFDSYSQILIIIIFYIVLYSVRCLSKKKLSLEKYISYIQWALSSFHEISIMYFTITIIFEFTYFTTTNVIRYVSIGLCLLINVYMLFYYVCRYYDLMSYSYLNITDPKYDYFVIKYGSILRNIRFQDHKQEQRCWSLKNLLKPYNYHFVSYVKKISMMIAIPLFYQYPFIQILALIIIQFIEIVRFFFTWPFIQRWRNILKAFLEIILFSLFSTLLIIQITADNLQNMGPQILTLGPLYNVYGWIGIGLVFIFNIGYLIIGFVDIYITCTYNTKELMNQQRKNYYFELLNNYEQVHQRVPVEFMDQWVKKGNLNNREINSLPTILYKIESYKIRCKGQKVFELVLKLVFQLFMENQFNYKDQNNVKPGKKIQFKTLINQQDGIYTLIKSIYDTYSNSQTTQINLYTLLQIDQSRYKHGQPIHLNREHMHQEIVIESKHKPKTFEIQLLQGFPLTQMIISEFQQLQISS